MSRIAFKEKGKEQYYRDDDGEWVKASEAYINALYGTWVASKGVDKYIDKDGFLVFDYKNYTG